MLKSINTDWCSDSKAAIPLWSHSNGFGKITNTFIYTLLNKSNEKKTLTIKVITPNNAEITYFGSEKIILKGDQILKGNINISFPEEEIKFSKQNMVIGVFDEKGKLVDSFETTFEGPFKLAL